MTNDCSLLSFLALRIELYGWSVSADVCLAICSPGIKFPPSPLESPQFNYNRRRMCTFFQEIKHHCPQCAKDCEIETRSLEQMKPNNNKWQLTNRHLANNQLSSELLYRTTVHSAGTLGKQFLNGKQSAQTEELSSIFFQVASGKYQLASYWCGAT